MKKLFLFFFTFFALNISSAQEDAYQLLEWEVIGLSGINPFGEALGPGIGLYTEPRVNINPRWSIGLRGDSYIYSDADSDESLDIGLLGSICLIGDYYFSTEGNVRTFAGSGVGYYHDGAESLGVMSRIGCEFGVFRFSADYNYVFQDNVPNHFTIRLGINIGGRYRVK